MGKKFRGDENIFIRLYERGVTICTELSWGGNVIYKSMSVKDWHPGWDALCLVFCSAGDKLQAPL